MTSRSISAIGVAAVAIGVSLLITSAVLLGTGEDPAAVFTSMWSYGTRRDSLISTVNRAIPFYLSAVAVAVGFKMRLFNIGVEGQYYLAALVAGAAAGRFAIWPPLDTVLALLVAASVGALWAGIAGVLKVKYGVNEVITTLMLTNVVTLGLAAYLLTLWQENTDAGAYLLRTPAIEGATFPPLEPVLALFSLDSASVSLSSGVLLALAVGVGYYALIWRTSLGLDIRCAGGQPGVAEASGVPHRTRVVQVMLISGALAGLVGMNELLFNAGRFTGDFPTGLGFTGIAIALLGRNSAAGMAAAALLWAFIERSSQRLDLEGVPSEIIVILQGAIVLTVVIAYEVSQRRAGSTPSSTEAPEIEPSPTIRAGAVK